MTTSHILTNRCMALLCLLILETSISIAQAGDSSNQKKASTDTSTKTLEKDKHDPNFSLKKTDPNPLVKTDPNPPLKTFDATPGLKTTANIEFQRVKVLEVFNQKYKDSSSERHNKGSIGDIIVVRVENMDSLIKLSQCKDIGGGCAVQKICLFIDGRLINNIYPISGAPQKIGGSNIWELQYQLERNEENDKIWATILGAPSFNSFFTAPVSISIGLQNEYAIETSDNFKESNFTFERIHKGWFWACSLIVVLYLFTLLAMVRTQGLLRDRGIDLSALNIKNNSLLNPYSLGRFQMAFWFSLTVISFFFIWLITDAYDIISSTVLGLIGISAGTSLSAAVMDNSKSTDILNQTIALQNELSKLNIEIPQLNAQVLNMPPAINAADIQMQLNIKMTRADEIQTLTARNKVLLTPQTSQGFFNDILTDVNGVSFHRLQMFVWTFVLGLIFLYSVWKSLSMPVFGPTLLALQGLTSATYLGFKVPEKQG